MNFLNDCFNTMLEYGEAVKNSFVKGHVSDWPEEKEETVDQEDAGTPDVPETTEPVEPSVPGGTIEDPAVEEGEL
jgi:hypothetical protein